MAARIRLARGGVERMASPFCLVRDLIDGTPLYIRFVGEHSGGTRSRIRSVGGVVEGMRRRVVLIRRRIEGVRGRVMHVRRRIEGMRRRVVLVRRRIEGMRRRVVLVRRRMDRMPSRFPHVRDPRRRDELAPPHDWRSVDAVALLHGRGSLRRGAAHRREPANEKNRPAPRGIGASRGSIK